ncbi:hypothetical protein ACTMU2_25295 [Cupriavidus basilensis]
MESEWGDRLFEAHRTRRGPVGIRQTDHS